MTPRNTKELNQHPAFNAWRGARQRCHNPRNSDYSRYGGRGIALAPEWVYDPYSFCAWCDNNLPPKPPGYTLDRIDNDQGYIPGNLRWSDMMQQGNNRSDNRFLEFQGERLSISEWGRKLNIKSMTLYNRLELGWTVERALTEPVMRGPRPKCKT